MGGGVAVARGVRRLADRSLLDPRGFERCRALLAAGRGDVEEAELRAVRTKGPKLLITDLSLSANNPNNPTHTAGTTF